MNTYEIRITNVNDDSDFDTSEVQSTDLSALREIVDSAFKETEVEFQYNDCYIVIFSASDEGYMYDIYTSKEDYENGKEAWDGGQCTSTLSNAIEMALSQV